MLEILGTIFGSIFSGGATGLIGVGIQRWFDFKNKEADLELQKLKYAQDLELKKLDLQAMDKEWAGRVQVAKTEAEAAVDVAASKAFEASYRPEARSYSQGVPVGKFGAFLLVVLDLFRGSVRPALTVYLCVLTTFIWRQAHFVLEKQPLTPQDAIGIWHLIVQTILYLTTTCVLWWFGTRNRQSAPRLK